MKRTLLLLLLGLLAIATPAAAAWHPKFDVDELRVRVGETAQVRVTAWWSGIWPLPFNGWTFESTDPAVALVTGSMPVLGATHASVTGVRPGEAAIWVRGYFSEAQFVKIEVYCDHENPVVAATPEIDTIIGRPVTLRAITPIAHRTAFVWYLGRVGDTSRPLAASGPEISLVAEKAGTQYAWVLATTPCSSSTAEFRIDARTSKQRAVRR